MTNPPRLLGERYEVLESAGAGGMAQVYRGTDTVLNRTVAIKVLGPQYAQDEGFVERFRREAQAAARLNHPNVVSVFDTGSDGPVHYIVMEYVAGRTLAQVLGAEGHLQPERAAEIAASVAGALSFAHAAGIVHRDVKPGNIMIAPSGEVKVMDFGIARAASSEPLTQTATVLGTASYLSPEQAQGGSVDARSDIYSLGVVLYESLTGQPPFQADSPVAVAYKHVQEAPVLPTEIMPGIPPDLEAVVLKAMAKNPANRYASAAEMREDLERFLSGRPVLATPVLADAATVAAPVGAGAAAVGEPTMMAAATEGLQRPAGRSRWLVGLGAGLLIGILVLVLTAGRAVLTGGEPPVTPSVGATHGSPASVGAAHQGPGPGAGDQGSGGSGQGGGGGGSTSGATNGATTAPTTDTGSTTAATSAPLPTGTSAAPQATSVPPASPVAVPSDPPAGGGPTSGSTSGPAVGPTSGP